MLTDISIKAAYPVAAAMASRGVALGVAQETPLARMVGAIVGEAALISSGVVDSAETTPDYPTALADASRTIGPAGVSEHDVITAEMIRVGALGVGASLSIAQNVVTPLIRSTVEQIDYIAVEATEAATKPLQLVPFFYKRIWNSPVVDTLCGRYATASQDLALRPLALAVPTNWVAALSTGIPSIDSHVAEFIADCDVDFLSTVWSEAFTTGNRKLVDVINAPFTAEGGTFGRTDAALMIYLAIRQMGENIPAGLNIELSAWRLYAAEVMSAAGAGVMAQLNRRASMIRSNQIVIGSPNGAAGRIFVFGDNYNTFLANGGSPEALLGAHVNGGPRLKVDAAREEIEACETAWRSAYSVLARKAEYARQEVILRAAYATVSKAIADAPEPRPCDPAVMQDLLKKAVAECSVADAADVWSLARRLICASMFAHTDAERILRGIDESAKANENLPVREAAFLATADYVIEWVLSQVTVDTNALRG